jgi:pyrroloquinoline quinone biosynthesis protein B
VSARSQTCVAVGADGREWFLVGASPDVRSQVEALPAPPRDALRHSPVSGILLACADLDHVLGLLSLREGGRLHVHATPAVRGAVDEGLALSRVLDTYCGVRWHEPPASLAPLCGADGRPSGLLYQAFPVAGRPPRYRARDRPSEPGGNVGYRIVDPDTGGRLAVIPGLAAIDDELSSTLDECDLLLIDGTFWSEHELRDAGVDGPTASATGHLPVGGPDGSLTWLAGLSEKIKIYIHLNNTNPMLRDDSPERRQVEAAGAGVGRDGMALAL